MAERWCPTCEEWTALVDRGVCAWCDTPLEERRRRGGWKRPDLSGNLTDAQLRALHRAHTTQCLSINALAKRIYARVGYVSYGSAASAISKGWQRLGLPARDRIEATVLASTTHGMGRRGRDEQAYRRWRRDQMGWNALQGTGQPTCSAVKVNPPGRGEPCTHHAMEGSDCCFAHDPARELERQAITARMRRRAPARPMLPAAPFVAWLQQLHAELGAWSRVAARVAMHPSQAHRFGRGLCTSGAPLERISVARVERCAEAAGTSVEAIYGVSLDASDEVRAAAEGGGA